MKKTQKEVPNIMVDTSIAFREAPSKKLAKIRELFNPVDFDKLEFEEEIGDFNLSLLSKEAVAKIIKIIREDELNRHNSLMDYMEREIENAPISREQETFKINPKAEKELYRKKIEDELEGKTEKEQMEYFQKKFDDHTEFLKNTKSPEEVIESTLGRKVVQDIGEVGIHLAELQRVKQDKELKENESELLLRQVFNQFAHLDPDMQKLLSEYYKNKK
jgi:hypothetical protein